jgi:hypothetical protein
VVLYVSIFTYLSYLKAFYILEKLLKLYLRYT